jgi:hypothetical protein
LLITESLPGEESYQCKEWFYSILARGAYIVVPEICIDEVSRGIFYIVRKNNQQVSIKLRNLQNLLQNLYYLPLGMNMLEQAAHLWSEAKLAG